MQRLHLVELIRAPSGWYSISKRLQAVDAKLELMDDGAVLATPTGSRSGKRPRVFTAAAIDWYEPMTPEEVARAEAAEEAAQAAFEAQKARAGHVQSVSPSPFPAPAPAVPQKPVEVARMADTYRYVKDPTTGRIYEIRGDEAPQEAPPPVRSEDDYQSEIAALKAQIAAQAASPVAQIVGAVAE